MLAVFNGEIYNHRELRSELQRSGHKIRVGSDAEVIPHAYEQWGVRFPEQFNGDFAIAVYDKRTRRLLLARDRLGIKPLFYTAVPQGLLFASEIKSLLVHPAVRRELDPAFLAQLFTFWTGVEGGSPFAEVRQVKAGTVVTFDASGRQLEETRYWDIPCRETVPSFQGSFEDCKAAFRAEFRKSVALRLQADVEVGTYTSGGVDSSAVNVAAYKDLNHTARQTFSVAFADEAYDESPFQNTLVESLGLRPRHVRCEASSIYGNLLDVIRHTESPIFRTAPVPMYMLSRRVADQGVKVVLTGEGADEVAWGYDIFRETKLRRFWSRQADSETRPMLFGKLYAYLPQFRDPRHLRLLVDFFKQGMEDTQAPLYSHQTRIANSKAVHLFLSPELKAQMESRAPTDDLVDSLPDDFASRTPLERCQYLEMRTLLHGYLLSSQGDRMLSAHGVEGRFPYLDHHFIEFMAGVPERYRLRGLDDKAILRESFADDLPASLIRRPKFAFRAPELYAFADDQDGVVAHHLDEQRLAEVGIFDPVGVKRLRYRLAHAPPGKFSTRENLAFIQILSTQMLHAHFVEGYQPLSARSDDVTVTYGDRLAGNRAAA